MCIQNLLQWSRSNREYGSTEPWKIRRATLVFRAFGLLSVWAVLIAPECRTLQPEVHRTVKLDSIDVCLRIYEKSLKRVTISATILPKVGCSHRRVVEVQTRQMLEACERDFALLGAGDVVSNRNPAIVVRTHPSQPTRSGYRAKRVSQQI